jgi:hypothetical protein
MKAGGTSAVNITSLDFERLKANYMACIAVYAHCFYGKEFGKRSRAASNVSEEEISAEEAQSAAKPLALLTSSISTNLLILDAKQAMLAGETG